MMNFKGTMTDPITGREISNLCWNQVHQQHEIDDANLECEDVDCKCLCHERED